MGVLNIYLDPPPFYYRYETQKIMHSAYSTISVFNYTTGLYMKTANVKEIMK